MSWTTPRTWVTGEVVTAAEMNTHIRDNLNALGDPTPGTTFPGSPSDGQRYVYVADSTNGIYWAFAYRAASSYWAFVGGAPLIATAAANSTGLSSTTYTAPTNAVAITAPFTATYLCEVSVTEINMNGTGTFSCWVGVNAGIDPTDYDWITATNLDTTSNLAVNAGKAAKILSVTSGQSIHVRYRVNAANVDLITARLFVTPVKK